MKKPKAAAVPLEPENYIFEVPPIAINGVSKRDAVELKATRNPTDAMEPIIEATMQIFGMPNF